jgi:small subunit ribosomal protein S5
MSEQEEKIIETSQTAEAIVAPVVKAEPTKANHDRGEFRKNTRKPARREPKAKAEFDNKLLEIRRVARVIAGGRRFSFAATVVAGDRRGRVGVGIGKASDTPIAIEKALRDAKKNMIKINLTKNASIRHEVESKYGGSVVVIRPAPGKGIIAGSSVRAVLEIAGITAVSAKILSRSKNKINNSRATVDALLKLK